MAPKSLVGPKGFTNRECEASKESADDSRTFARLTRRPFCVGQRQITSKLRLHTATLTIRNPTSRSLERALVDNGLRTCFFFFPTLDDDALVSKLPRVFLAIPLFHAADLAAVIDSNRFACPVRSDSREMLLRVGKIH